MSFENKIPKKGDWIFTCSLKPLRFDRFEEDGDNFLTIEGSSHSLENCGIRIISDDYAKWFWENNIHELFDRITEEREELSAEELNKLPSIFDEYKLRVKNWCALDNIEFEGV